MTFASALAHFKTQRSIANALGIKEQAIGQWKKSGVVPIRRAHQLEELTKGKVKVDASVYARDGENRGA
jgi:DNA-binding transcriptional regulator YdaS (Cro superfamily)